ncbi:protein I'm not dead yet-like isoform X2 [Trichoplusia ni]|uniref:Protein I'm not dead yet-like isoform X2 n=1 Tax=Trichoplusia ni TaxID=7111 RepID=A0A7E5V9U1_TRINI|nr:protein I'm not dead yet-like isoform X2 [Trichoplusia ni]
MFEYLKNLADRFILGRPPKEKPRPPTMARRITNLMRNNFKGLIGTIVPIIVLPWEFKRYSTSAKTGVMWKLMFWFLLVQPVNIPVSSLIPIFFLPLMGIMSSTKTCQCYMNENILLYLLSGMLLLLLSNAGFDRRLALWFLASGRARQYSPRMLLFKVCMAAFIMSMFCNRLLVTSILTQHVNSAMAHMQLYLKVKPTPKTKPKVKEVIHVNFEELRYILNCAIQTSAGIGSIAIMHCTYTTVYFRAIFAESSSKFEEYPDIFNYLQYSAFAYPVACTAIVLNLAYFMAILTVVIKPQLPHRFLEELRKTFEKYRSKIPRICSKHERLAILFTMIYLICFFCRFSFFHTGWADYRMDEFSPTIARIKDATTAAIFVLLLHTIPRSYGFLTYIDADRKSELPPCKPESAILFWRFWNCATACHTCKWASKGIGRKFRRTDHKPTVVYRTTYRLCDIRSTM